MAFRLDIFIISVTACLYAWLDYANNTYQFCMCRSFYLIAKSETDFDVIKRKYLYFLIYQISISIPFSIFSSFIVINLTFRSAIDFVNYLLRYRKKSLQKCEDSFCCDFLNVNDKHEIIYSQCDIDYVLDLFNRKNSSKNHFNQVKHHEYLIECVEERNFKTKLARTLKYIFKWDTNFRFSSRVVNTLVVSFVALYYFVVVLTYTISYLASSLTSYIPNTFDPNKAQFPFGRILCNILIKIFKMDSCNDSISSLSIPIPVPDMIIQAIPWLRDSIFWIFVAPLIFSPIICLIQIYLLSNDIKTHLKQMYKGECDFVRKAKRIGNGSIANGSFHFGG